MEMVAKFRDRDPGFSLPSSMVMATAYGSA